jgi:hypothetical protein
VPKNLRQSVFVLSDFAETLREYVKVSKVPKNLRQSVFVLSDFAETLREGKSKKVKGKIQGVDNPDWLFNYPSSPMASPR